MRRLVCAALAATLLVAPAARSFEVLGLTTTGSLARFDSTAPGTIVEMTAVTGLGGMTLVAIDVSHVNGTLYGLGASGGDVQLFTIDRTTGVATAATGNIAITGIGAATQLDLEVVSPSARAWISANVPSSSDGPNLVSVDLTTGLVSEQLDFQFDEFSNGEADGPVVAIAKTVFDRIESLVQAASAVTVSDDFSSFLIPIANVGLAFTANAGLDVTPSPTHRTFAILQTGGVSGFYELDSVAGTLPLGAVGDGSVAFRGMTIPKPSPRIAFASETVMADESTLRAEPTIACDGCDFVTASADWRTVNGTGRAGIDYFPASGTVELGQDAAEQTVSVELVDDTARKRGRVFDVEITSVTVAELVAPAVAHVAIDDDDGAPIEVSQALVKPGALAKLAAKGSFPLPVGDGEDPRLAGGSLVVAGASGEASYVLAPEGWQPIGGSPAKGWRYKDASCTVNVKPKQIAASCKGATGTIALPEAGPVDLVLALGDLRYCGQCGGTVSGNPAKAWKRKACEAQEACPAP